jgi:hypothetical protein
MKPFKKVNEPIQTGVTYEELKTFKGFENITEAEAEKELETINRISKILYCMYMKEQNDNNNLID